ncbi:hypothetical protein GUITHDRAFT_155601 [Guillardia theta CCMP2712]|uniref:EF-hand domain-containing protein n=4 Tax=Guillardia theta TaxID=55529 RepID=L1IFD1_GUITC|nr:hypothetical protein GUITHDRAFT_155601 [Guillardia theta CCMP2712]EKX34966.1 hypothetical protein GUITHDRAFT_155601 [Guillardia theta CCMP2712]|mmetsp:Transcript_35767/g.111894  ORF Transcript_35767/g.111894 Transcript_35767/m.111894 type:complete len:451 (+) Transcript_35767:88-1440(+)|eukprot:XP_005821946.1 hypothetical protein GUITHDRAFT_155601 [Guillardia theta CCMP2712]
MTSKFGTTHSIPSDFPEILKEFVREILREQPKNIFAFGSKYFNQKLEQYAPEEFKTLQQEHLVEYLTDIFVKSDEDGNGVLDKREFKTLLQNANLGLTKKQIKLLYSQADMNEDGLIQYREFIPACIELISSIQARKETQQQVEEAEQSAAEAAENYVFRGIPREEIEVMVREAFDEADKDKSGYLDVKEFHAFLRQLPLNLTKREINMAMIEVDENQDGKVSLEEFIPLFHMVLIEMVKNSIISLQSKPSQLSDFLVQCCREYDKAGKGFLTPARVSRALRDADLGLSKFQILNILAEAGSVEGNGIEYEPFIVNVAGPMITRMFENEEEIQFQQTEAWKQVNSAEIAAEQYLGMSRDEFTSIMGSVFQQYDTDKSGYLDLGEFMAAMRDSGIPFTDKQLIMLMAEADQNDDGAIQYAEFADVALQLMLYAYREEQVQNSLSRAEQQES